MTYPTNPVSGTKSGQLKKVKMMSTTINNQQWLIIWIDKKSSAILETWFRNPNTAETSNNILYANATKASKQKQIKPTHDFEGLKDNWAKFFVLQSEDKQQLENLFKTAGVDIITNHEQVTVAKILNVVKEKMGIKEEHTKKPPFGKIC